MPRMLRVISGLTAAGLLVGTPAVAGEVPAPAASGGSAEVAAPPGPPPAPPVPVPDPTKPADPAVVEEILDEVPVKAKDVTRSDASLRSTRNEVTVIAEDDHGSPTVVKLRAKSGKDAEELTSHLNTKPGVVAARNTKMRSFALPNEPLAGLQWNLPMVGAEGAWARTQGSGVVVAVIDTGVDASHRDLAGQVLPEIDLLPRVTPTVAETYHGTAVASLIAAAANGWGMAGLAPQARVLPVSALDPSGVGDTSTVAEGIIAAANAGARVINMSLGGPDRDPVLDRACDYAHSRGAVLVAAAGNSYNDGNEVQYPAASPKVIAVASVDRSGTPSAFSNTGKHIDLAAPGEDVLAATPDGGHATQTGTSFATPHVAAAAALVASANPKLSSAEIVSAVQLTAEDDASGNGKDRQIGHGIVRADRAVATALVLRGPGLRAKPKLKLRKFNARPEPIRRGKVATFTVRVKAKFRDGRWRNNPVPTEVRFQFKRSGTRKYRNVATISSGTDGRATLKLAPTRSGKWRAKVRKPNGKWAKSRVDYLKVRR